MNVKSVIAFFFLFFCLFTKKLMFRSKVVGVLTQDVFNNKNHKESSFIPLSIVKMLKISRMRWVPLKRRDSIGNLKRKLKHLDAVILTGNYRHIEDEKKRKEILVSYAETVKIVLEHAIKRNEDGWAFPVYAFDFGFEALVYHMFEDKVSFKPVIFEREMRDLKLTRNRHRWKELRTFVYRFHNDACEYERIFHFDKKTALLNDELKACKECRSLGIYATTMDEHYQRFVSIARHRKYPIWAFQFNIDIITKKIPLIFKAKRDLSERINKLTLGCFESAVNRIRHRLSKAFLKKYVGKMKIVKNYKQFGDVYLFTNNDDMSSSKEEEISSDEEPEVVQETKTETQNPDEAMFEQVEDL